ncbi:TPA: bacterial Ig-like domain-containing protein [Enterococcus faecalis]|nr:bacterial Ig-like domain-containing protein [Enterococcus faecalis]HEM7729867.1 bacterial Ig-like domain-containing protein [Enterococcus faecalis]
MRRYVTLLIGNLVLTTLSPIGPIATGNSQLAPEKEISQTQTIETGTNEHNIEQETKENDSINNNDVEVSSSVPNEEKLDSSITNLSTDNDKETTAKQPETRDVVSRSAGDIWTSPKYENDVEMALIEKSKKEIGNIIREGLKKVTNTEIGYLKGDSVDIDIGKAYNIYSASSIRVVTYKEFASIIPTNEVMSIGSGYDDTSVSIPIGTEGLSSDGSLKFKVISNQKIRVERVKNKHISSTVKLPMYVPLTSNGTFYYQSAKESIFTGHAQQSPIFVDLKYNRYNHPLKNKMVNLYYDRLEENWQWNKGDINILDHISLEDSPEVQATPKKSSFDMPTKAPSTPEEYVTTSNTMTGGTLTYTWIDQLDVNAKSDQNVRVKVVNQLDDYKHEATTTLKFKANPDKTSVIVKDSSLYQGQAYNPEADNFVSATDVNGNPLKWDDPNLKISGDTVDMKAPKIYNQTLTYTYTLNGETKTKKADYKVEVKEDKSSITTKDIIIYTGQNWTRKDNFVSATDEDGNDVPWSDGRIDTNGARVNTTTPSEYTFKYTFKGKVKNTNSSPKVTVKQDQTRIIAANITYYVGDKYNPEDAFKSATDKDGNPLDFDESMCWPVDTNKPVDTSTPGRYDVCYGLKKASGKLVKLNKYVFVKEKELSLSVPKDFSFGSTVLGKSKKLYWDKKAEVSINNEGNRKWELTTKLTGSSNQDFSNYLKFKNQSFKEGSVLIDSGATSKNITNELTEDNFIYVDYSSIKSIRKDKATLEWTLSPSTKEVSE